MLLLNFEKLIVYSLISSLTSTFLVFLAAKYEKTKKHRHIRTAGTIKVTIVILLSILVTPTILSNISSSGFVKNREQMPPITEPVAETIRKRKANCL